MNTEGMHVTSRIVLTILAAGALVAVSACSGGQSAGTPRPETQPTTATSTTGSSTSSTKGNDSLADTDPCTFITTGEATELKASGPPKRDKVGTADVCKWVKSGVGNFSVGIRTNLGLAQVIKPEGGQVTDIKIGDREAKQISGNAGGSCIIALGISSSSRVDVSALERPNEDPCPMALKVAELVEPKLP